MNASWQETQAKLVAIQQEYNLICRAWRATTNSQRDGQFRALASACLVEVQMMIQQYAEATQGKWDASSTLITHRERGAPDEKPRLTTAAANRRHNDPGPRNSLSTALLYRSPHQARRP